MNPLTGAGLVGAAGGVTGYVVGLFVPYPGRAFSLTLLMFGLSVLAVGRADAQGDAA